LINGRRGKTSAIITDLTGKEDSSRGGNEKVVLNYRILTADFLARDGCLPERNP
jgi:hypothetical protein